MRKVESTTTLKFARAPLPRNVTFSDLSLSDALTTETLFGTNEDRTAQIQRGVEKSILHNLRILKHSVDVWADPLTCFQEGVESIVKDSFTECFRPRPPENWNFGPVLFVVWSIGWFVRNFILFPVRIMLLLLGTLVFALGCLVLSLALPFFIRKPMVKSDQNANMSEEELKVLQADIYKKLQNKYYKKWLHFYSMWWTFVLAIVIKVHGTPPVKRPNQIYVANHTSLIDFVVLKSIVDMASVGQKHTGLVGFMQDRMVEGIWFERFETRQRSSAADMIKEWIRDEKNDRLLIFPEGVCVNNEYCLMFKKRVFEIEDVEICPVAIKYNKSWSDPYWSSRDESFLSHVCRLMRCWCTVCDVYFLEPEKMREGESSIEFSSRVKANIAKRAGLKNLNFDGYLKYYVASEKLGEKRKKLWAQRLLEQFPEVANMDPNNNNNNNKPDEDKKESNDNIMNEHRTQTSDDINSDANNGTNNNEEQVEQQAQQQEEEEEQQQQQQEEQQQQSATSQQKESTEA
jgi:glycerol-3-phosphate O-acyltransferase 3/4